MRLALLFIAIIATGNVIASEAQAKREGDRDIQALLKEYVEQNGSVGAAVGWVNGETIQFFSYGKKAVDGDERISEETLFEIGSLTKVFTTLALMEMASTGWVDLDDPISFSLPGVKVPAWGEKKITLRHLATHHSGLPRMPDNFSPQNQENPYVDYTIEHLYTFLKDCSLQSPPGETFEYSNVGMGLLGHILCKKAEKSYEELISDKITHKLAMNHTCVAVPTEKKAEFAKGHHLGQVVEHWEFTEAIAGAGALRSNVKDMTQFLAANLGFFHSPVVDLLQECHKPQSSVGPGTEIGLGWICSHSDHADVIWHNGGTGGFRTFLGFNPKTLQGVVILINSTDTWPDQLGLSLLDFESLK